MTDANQIALDLLDKIEATYTEDHPGGNVQLRAQWQVLIRDAFEPHMPGSSTAGEIVEMIDRRWREWSGIPHMTAKTNLAYSTAAKIILQDVGAIMAKHK